MFNTSYLNASESSLEPINSLAHPLTENRVENKPPTIRELKESYKKIQKSAEILATRAQEFSDQFNQLLQNPKTADMKNRLETYQVYHNAGTEVFMKIFHWLKKDQKILDKGEETYSSVYFTRGLENLSQRISSFERILRIIQDNLESYSKPTT